MSQHAPAIQYRPALTEAFLAQTGLIPEPEPLQGQARPGALAVIAAAFGWPPGIFGGPPGTGT